MQRTMRKVPGPRAKVLHNPRRTNRSAAVRKVAGGGVLLLLSMMFWAVFYQNLPDRPLNELTPQTIVDTGAPSQGYAANSVDRAIKICMIVISLSVIAARWSLARLLAKAMNPGLAAFMVLAPLSAFWSIDSNATLLRFTTLACVFLVVFAIPLAGWDRRRLQQVAIPPAMLILIISIVLGIMYPDRIVELGDDLSQKDAWHGITLSKNHFGMMSSVGVIFCFYTWLAREGRTAWAIAGTVLAFVCLLLSRSNTSLLATVVAVLFLVLVMRVPVIKQRYSTHLVVAIATTILVYQLAIQDVIPGVNTLLKPVMSLTGKDTTFSSRTMIWEIIKQHSAAYPYLGSGYGAYWTGASPNSPSYIFVWLMSFYPTEAHNGYLEIKNDLGIVGLVCLLAFLYWYMRQALQLMRFDRNQAALYLALLFQEMVMNMSESDWFSRSSTFAILILASVCMSRALLEERWHAQSIRSAGR